MKKRIPELDGIRGMAILLVLICHYLVGPIAENSGPLLRLLRRVGMQTWSGVDLFFVLSGFLIGGILVDARDSVDYFRTFYIRRVFRILPIYVLICGVYFGLRAVSAAAMNDLFAPPMPWYVYAGFLQNFWLAQHHSWSGFLFQTWSLAVEEQFYLMLPAMIWFTPRRYLWRVIATLAMASAALRFLAYAHYYPTWKVAAYALVFCRADALLLGVLAALAVRSEGAVAVMTGRRWLLPMIGWASFAILAAFTVEGWGAFSTPMSTVGYSVNAVLYTSVLLITVTAPASALARIFRQRWLRWLGTIAYCLYLVHMDFQALAYRLFGYSWPQLSAWRDLFPLTVGLGFSLIVCHFSWKYFESAMVRIGHRFTYRKALEAPPSAPRGRELAAEAAVP